VQLDIEVQELTLNDAIIVPTSEICKTGVSIVDDMELTVTKTGSQMA
jgi:hypothetical protein